MSWKYPALAAGVSIASLANPMCVSAQTPTGDFFVSPTGTDANLCTSDTKPCGTLQGVRDKLRAAIAAPGGKKRNWTVMLRGGWHKPQTHLVLDNRDGVDDGYAVTWREYPGERVKVSGGRQITGWVVGADGRWRVTLPEVKSGAWYFADIWINGTPSLWPIRPRKKIEDPFEMAFAVSPTGSSADDKVKNVVWDSWGGYNPGSNRFGFEAGELSASWTNLTDVRIALNEAFNYTSLYRLAAVDTGSKIATMQAHMFYELRLPATVRKWNRQNVFEDLSDPGEHYLNRVTGELTYIPRLGETPAKSIVTAPYLPRLVEIRNNGTSAFTRNITFSGIAFSYTNDPYSKEGWTGIGPNAAYLEGGAITIQAATRIRIERSTFEHLGQTAIKLGRAAKGNVIDGVKGYDLAGGLVSAGWDSRCPVDMVEYWPSYDPVVQCPTGVNYDDVGSNVIKNFLVFDYAKKRTESPAIAIWHGSNNLVSHGEIYDGPGQGVHVGNTDGCKAFGENTNNVVEYVHIHDLGYNRKWWSWDYAAIYTVGPNEGSRFHHNYIHHISGSDTVPNWEARGFYADNCSVGTTFDNNVVYKTDEASMNINHGSGIVVTNNLFVAPVNDGIRCGDQRGGTKPVLTFTRNVVYQDTTEPVDWCGDWTLLCTLPISTIIENNGVYFRKQAPFTQATRELTIAQWIAAGNESGLGPQSQNSSWNVDPLLIDPANPRLGLKSNSPAFAKGFKQIDLSTVGPIGPVGSP